METNPWDNDPVVNDSLPPNPWERDAVVAPRPVRPPRPAVRPLAAAPPSGARRMAGDDPDVNWMDRFYGSGDAGDPWTRGIANLEEYTANIFGAADRAARALTARALGIEGRNVRAGDSWLYSGTFGEVAGFFQSKAEENRRTALPAMGALARAPQTLGDYFDPRRIGQVFGEGAPTLIGMAIGSRVTPALSAIAMSASSAEDVWQGMDRWEASTGQVVSPGMRLSAGIVVGAGTAALERLGIDSILRVGRSSGARQMIMRGLVSSLSEGGTEALQEGLAIAAESAYQSTGTRFTLPSDTADRLIQSFYGGVVLGASGGLTTGALSRLAYAPKAGMSIIDYQAGTDGILRPMFRVDDQSSPLYGQTITLEQATASNLEVPAYRRELYKRQVVASSDINLGHVELTAQLLDYFANGLGVDTETFLAQQDLMVTSQAPVGSALYQFVGVGAQLSPEHKDNYRAAMVMEQEGLSGEDIRAATGWFKDVDFRWKYELDISKTQLKPEVAFIGNTTTLMDAVGADHPVIQAYPQLAFYEISFEDLGDSNGAFDPDGNRITVAANSDWPNGNMRTFEDMQITVAHEIQHAVQEIEGFAKGGNPEVTGTAQQKADLTRLRFEKLKQKVEYDRYSSQWRRLRRLKDAGEGGADIDARIQEAHDKAMAAREEHNTVHSAGFGIAKQMYDQYFDLAGEREARNAGNRLRMTAEQRLAMPIDATLDPPRTGKVVISFDGSVAMSRNLPPETPVWTSKMYDELTVPGRLPKKGTGREMLAAVQRLAESGRFKMEELEWSGLREVLDSDEVLTRDQVGELIQNGGVSVQDITLAVTPGAVADVAAEDRHALREAYADTMLAQMVENGYSSESTSAIDRQDIYQEFDGYMNAAQQGNQNGLGELNNGLYGVELSPGAEAALTAMNQANPVGSDGDANFPVYGQYTMPGGKNYKELLLTLPSKPFAGGDESIDINAGMQGVSANYRGPHWQQPNVLAHIRTTDRVDAQGKRVLFIEEIQSDWHQAGRKVGYGHTREELAQAIRDLFPIDGLLIDMKAEDMLYSGEAAVDTSKVLTYARVYAERTFGLTQQQAYDMRFNSGDFSYFRDRISDPTLAQQAQEFAAKYKAFADRFYDEGRGVPDAPFKSTWQDLAIKRMLRIAAEQGYDYLALTQGEIIARAVGADEDSNAYVYDKVLPSLMKKLAKEDLHRVVIKQPGFDFSYEVEKTRADGRYTVVEFNADGEATATLDDFATEEEAETFIARRMSLIEYTKPSLAQSTFNAIPITDKLYSRVMQGQPLFQDMKGAYSAEASGRRLIHLMQGADISTLIHEVAHHFRQSLSGEEAATAESLFGVKDNQWTVDAEEHFARAYERFVRTGKTKHKALHGTFQRLREGLVRIYMGVKGTAIDVELSPQMKTFFDELLDTTLPHSGENVAQAAKWFTPALEFFSVRAQWERAGAPNTGEAIIRTHSNVEASQFEGTTLYERMHKLLKTPERLLDVALTHESKERTELLMQSGDEDMKKAVGLYSRYLEEALREYQRLGGLQEGFVENMKARLYENVQSLIPKGLSPAQTLSIVDGTASDAQLNAMGINAKKAAAINELFNSLGEINDVQYSPIVLSWFEKYASDNPDGARKTLKLLNAQERKTMTLQGLLDAGVLDRANLSMKDIIASYATRKGKDVGLLKIREAGISEGQVIRAGRGEDAANWYTTQHPLFKGYKVSPAMSAWLHDITAENGGFSIVRRFMNAQKVLTFYNPMVLNTYNVIQLAMAGLQDGRQLPGAVAEGFTDWKNRTPEFWAALDNGISSQPFSLPWAEYRRNLDRIDRFGSGSGKLARIGGRALVGALAGAKIGTVLFPGVGTVGGAITGAGLALSPHVENMKRFGRGAMSAVKGDFNKEMLGDLAAWGTEPLRQVYEMSWDSAWSFDLMSRLMLNRLYLRQGLSTEESAIQAAKVFGDYANVPTKTRKMLNTFLFTPTYKIAMAQLFSDSIRSAGNQLQGTGNISTQQRAAVVLNTTAIVFGYHLMMVGLGWEPDEFGRRYYKNVEVEEIPGLAQEKQPLNVGQPKELVTVFGGPHDLFYKFWLRVKAANGPTVPSAFQKVWQSSKWELHPSLRMMLEMFENNEGADGEPILSTLDTPEQKAGKVLWYLTSNTMSILKAYSGETTMDPQGARLFEQEYGKLSKTMVGAIVSQYSRDTTPIRIVKKQQQIVQELLRQVNIPAEDISRGLTQKELDKLTLPERQEKLVEQALKRLDILQQELNEYQLRGEIKAEVEGDAAYEQDAVVE